jgi:hypothetical protein
MEDKLSNYKKEIGERHINEFIGDILKEKFYYQQEYLRMTKEFLVLEGVKKTLFEQYPDLKTAFVDYETENKEQIEQIIENIYRAQQITEEYEKDNKEARDKKKSKVEPNKELIRLLKKEKLSKELHEEALNEAIEKNEELISIKQIYERNLEKLEKKCKLLYAENTIFALRLAEYDAHYCRYSTHNRKFYEEGDIQGLRAMTEARLKEYGKAVQQYFQTDQELYQKFDERLKEQVELWSEFICDSPEVKR